MCGLVSFISKAKAGFFNSDVDLFTQFLFTTQLRGADSTGIFYNFKKKNNTKITKSTLCANDFIQSTTYQEATNTIYNESNFIVGHCRSATTGNLNIACAHPFREQHITLAHNGTLTTYKELNEDSIVDSHAICHSFAHRGEIETLKMIKGAFALIWYNTNTQTLNMCRNYQRPLHLIETPSFFIACSEPKMAEWLLDRNNIKIVNQTIIKLNTIYSFKLEDLSTFTETSIIDKDTSGTPYVCNTKSHYTTINKYYDNKDSTPSNKSFSFGQKIRFKFGLIRKTLDNFYLEGDILKNQQLIFVPTKKDYEDEWRIKIYGTKEELEKLILKQDMIGIVQNSLIQNAWVTYIVGNVEEYKPEPLKFDLPENKSNKFMCDWCGQKTPTLIDMYSSNVCPECANINDTWSTGTWN